MATRWARVVRGLVASVFAVFVAGFAHVAGGGAAPGVIGSALVLALCVPASILLAGRSVSLVRLSVAVALSQGAFHVLFWLTGDSAARLSFSTSTGMHAMAGMDASAATTHLMTAHGASVAGPMAASGWMWAAHGAAAALTVIALRYGEGAFWAFVGAARLTIIRVIGRIVLGVVEHGRSVPIDFAARHDRRDAPFLGSGLRHRGPPARTAASAA